MKQCRKCLHWKGLDDFYKQSDTRDKRGSYCKECQNAARRALAKAFPERERAREARWRKDPAYAERKADAQRRRRFLKRMARARASGVLPTESMSRAKY